MGFSRHIVVVGLAAVLTGCASAPPSGEAGRTLTAATEVADTASPYGLYLAGRAAIGRGDAAQAAALLERASREDEAAPFLAQRAFQAALTAGAVTRAAELAPQGAAAPDDETRQLGLLVRGVEALASGHGADARTLLTSEDIGQPHHSAFAVLIPWAAAAAGRTEESLTTPDVRGDAVAAYFGRLGQGRLFERAGRLDEAEQAYREVIAQGDLDGLGTLALGEMYERRGRWQEAIAAYEGGVQGPSDIRFLNARDRARLHRIRPPAQSLMQGAAEVLVGPAQSMIVQRRNDLAMNYLRLVLRLDPDRPDALVLVGDLLTAQSDAAGAREAYARVPQGAPQFFIARSKLAWSLYRGGEVEQGVAEARRLAEAAPQASGAALTLAEMLRMQGRFDESAAVISRVMDDPAARPDWRLYYMRAQAWEEGGHPDRAEADVRAGLALSPQQSELMNFLAYTWIDRGERLDEAMTLAQQAAAASPDSAEVQDSLGWGYYRQGRYPQSVEALERAVLLAPANAAINDHLGDAYWRSGRRVEAVFQWRRVLTLEPSPRLRAAATAKIASPLGPDAPPPAAPSAAS